MGIETDGLRLFALAAELLNTSAAGRRLGMAPAVSSVKLAKLEHAIGAELLHRTTGKISLSIEGADFLPFAREMIAQKEAALVAFGKGSTKVSGTLRFTARSTFAQIYIAPILPRFLDQFPDVALDMHLSDMQFDLIEGSCDLALRCSPLVETSLKGFKLADNKRILLTLPPDIRAIAHWSFPSLNGRRRTPHEAEAFHGVGWGPSPRWGRVSPWKQDHQRAERERGGCADG
ncbi:MAG: LysR family transcriptional regulator [Pseudomonadota bacterium]